MVLIDTHIVPASQPRVRLYDYVRIAFPTIPSRKASKKLLDKGSFKVNKQRASTGTWIQAGDVLDYFDLQHNPPKAYPLDITIVFEDEHLAVVHKPAGVPVSGNYFKTMVNALVGQIKLSKEPDALGWAKPAHRLDAPTSGLLIVGKTHTCLTKLGELFVNKEIHKTYRAVVKGSTPIKGKIGLALDGKESLSVFRKLREVPSSRNKYLSLVEVYPKTGRTHQIRRHLSGIGHPIIGDKEYDNPENTIKHKGLLLAAVGLEFTHPITGKEVKFTLPTPHKFEALLEREHKNYRRNRNLGT